MTRAVCTDDFAGWLPLQTNLALKGIIGIKAMSELSRIMELPSQVKYYQVRLLLWHRLLTFRIACPRSNGNL